MSRHHHEDLFDTLVEAYSEPEPVAVDGARRPGPPIRTTRRPRRAGAGGRRVSPRWRRIVVGVLIGLLVVAVGVGAGLYVVAARLNGHVARIHGAFEGIEEKQRPPVQAGTTILLGGLDTRSDEPTTGTAAREQVFVPGRQRTDTMMLVHFSEDGKSVVVVSIPRDTWVDIAGHGKDKINGAYSAGGPPLLISTVERLTGVRIDHFALVDFYGFKAVVDAVGGVDVQVAEDTYDDHHRLNFHKGINHISGDRALEYVRQRHNLAEGEFDRQRRQQNLMRAIITKVAARNSISNPVGTYRLIDAGTRSISVDDTFSMGQMRSLALTLLGLGASNIVFMNAPVREVGQEGQLTVVRLDEQACAELWDSIKSDTFDEFAASHKSALLPATPR